MGYYPFDTIENVAIAAFDDGAPVPVKQLELAITPVQTGIGDPAPDNVRPIYGFTKADIFVNGVNQWGEQWEIGGYNVVTGAKETDTRIINKTPIPVKPNTKYFALGLAWVLEYDANGDYLGIYNSGDSKVITTSENTYFINIKSAANKTVYENNISINYPATEIAYHKSIVEVYNVEFPVAAGTVYGGTLKYTGGGNYLLTVDNGYKDLGTLTWQRSADGIFYTNSDFLKMPSSLSEAVDAICSAYKVVAYNAGVAGDKVIYTSWETAATKALYVKDSDYATVEEFAAAIDGVELVYALKTPQTYEITAEAVETLYKNNVIFTNTGNIIKLEYRLNQLDYYRRLEMYNFGYIMMDGGGIDLSSSDPQTITGAWARTATAIKTCKPIFAYNTKYGSGKNLTPVPCFAWYINSTTAVIVGATLHIQVTSDDTCVVQDVAPSVNRAITMGIDELAKKAVDVDELKTAKAKAKK